MKKRSYCLNIFTVLAFACPLFAQQNETDSLKVNELALVTVTAYRVEMTDLATPLSMTRIGQGMLQTGTQQLSLDEALMSVPGLFVQNGNNFAQDIRVSIRGFGARSQFGIRGVKILVDGFPESTPDGTSQVDAVDPSSLTGLTVIRSGTGGLYGNASGGSISFNTLKFNDEEWGEASASGGSFRFGKFQFKTGGGTANKFLYSLNGSYTSIRGYREHSFMSNYVLNGGFLFPLDSSLNLKLVATYVNSPEAEDPGSLDSLDAALRPKHSENDFQEVGESLWQLRVGLGIDKIISPKNSLHFNAFQTNRSFVSRLVNDYVELERSFTGGTFSFKHKSSKEAPKWDLNMGLDVESQHDHRLRFNNDGGQKEAMFANQLESFNNLGAFVVQRISLGKRLQLLPAFRLDFIQIKLKDKFLDDNSDDSYEKTFFPFNPSLGLTFMLNPNLNLYANVSRNFETPTLLELSQSGPGLKPQNSITSEIGIKSLFAGGRLRFDAALFQIWLNQEIILEFDWVGSPSYRNAGKSQRQGIELSAAATISKHFSVNSSLCLANYEFLESQEDFEVLDGNKTPGLPSFTWASSFQYQNEGFYVNFGLQHFSDFYVNNENTAKSKAYLLGSIKIGSLKEEGKFRVGPFLGINNLFNEKYYSNVRINSFNPFEPAPPINFYFGIKAKF